MPISWKRTPILLNNRYNSLYLSPQHKKHSFIHKDTCTLIFIAALNTILSKIWKQPKCQIWMNGLRCDRYTVEYYSTVSKDTLCSLPWHGWYRRLPF